MTEADAQPPHDPAQIPPIEQRASPDVRPLELPLSVTEPAAASPAPVPLPPPYSPPLAASLPPLSTPPPRDPLPPPFEPLPPGAPPPPPTSPPFYGYGGPEPTPGATPRGDGSGWAMAAHLTSLIGCGLPPSLIGLLGPLIVWLANKDQYREVDWHGRESLNFQLNMLILWLVALPLYCLCGLGFVIHVLQPFYMIVLVIVASIQAADGKRYRYPFTLRLLND